MGPIRVVYDHYDTFQVQNKPTCFHSLRTGLHSTVPNPLNSRQPGPLIFNFFKVLPEAACLRAIVGET